MITYIQAIILGAIQGATELFPVSSLGHSIIVPQLLDWKLDQNADFFLIFLVATHLATSLVLLGFYWKDWLKIISGMARSIFARGSSTSNDPYARLGWLIVVATIPAGLLGLVFEHKLKMLFASPLIVAGFLVLNGLMLFAAESLSRKSASGDAPADHSDAEISGLSWMNALKIGCAQTLALLPGFSRTGATLGGGLLVGLDHRNAARLSFLMATPIIMAAAVLKLPQLFTEWGSFPTGQIIAGSLAAAIGAYLSVAFLTRYFETRTLKTFASYCLVIGSVALVIFLTR